MMPKGFTLLLVLPFVGALSFLGGCDAPPVAGADTKAKPGEAGAAEAGAAEGGAAVEGDAESCATLTKQICDKAGPTSGTCTSFTSTAKLFSANTCAVALADIEHSYTQLAEAGKACAALAERLCKDLGPDTQTCKMVEKETPNMPPEQCEGMTAEYDKVLAELERMEAKNKPLPADKIAKIATGEGIPAFGPADATVTVVEFSDFQCPYCTMAATALNELKPKYGDRVRFVFRQFPLSFHQDAHLAAQASLAAQADGKFWEFHDKLFANQKALSRADLEKYAEEVGVDMVAFKKALDEGTYKKVVDDDMALGGEVYVDGTPTMFINGVRVANPSDVASISAELDKALGS